MNQNYTNNYICILFTHENKFLAYIRWYTKYYRNNILKGNKPKDVINLHEKVSQKCKFLRNFISE